MNEKPSLGGAPSGRLTPKPMPKPEGLNAEFYRECASGRLCFQRCDDCGTWRHLPRYLCASCGSAAFHWTESSGRGRIFSWTITHQAAHPAFAADTPFAIVVVEMEEGVRLVSDMPGVTSESLALDLAVEVFAEPLTSEIGLPRCRLVK
jgi:uncharacterized OB-fold protein